MIVVLAISFGAISKLFNAKALADMQLVNAETTKTESNFK